LEIFKKPGLVKEMLSSLSNLTPDKWPKECQITGIGYIDNKVFIFIPYKKSLTYSLIFSIKILILGAF